MPSTTHAWLVPMVLGQRGTSPTHRPGEQERTWIAELAEQVTAPLSVTETAVEELPGSLLFTPSEARDDLVLLHIHDGGFRTRRPGDDRIVAGGPCFGDRRPRSVASVSTRTRAPHPPASTTGARL